MGVQRPIEAAICKHVQHCEGHAKCAEAACLRESLLPSGQEPTSDQQSQGTLDEPQAVFNLTNLMMGSGVLSVPYAFKESGYTALLIMCVVRYITGQTASWLGSAIEMASSSPEAAGVPASAWDFGFLAEVCLGKKFRLFISAAVVLEMWFALVTFMAMNGASASVLWPSLSPSWSVPFTGIIAMALVFVPQRFFSYLSLVSTMSMIGAAAAMIASTFMLTEWAEPQDDAGLGAWDRTMNFPRSAGILIFCFAGHPCFPAIKTGMKVNGRWRLCVDVSFTIAFAYYALFGALGYMAFGQDVAQTLTANLANIHDSTVCRYFTATCFLLKVQLTAPLMLNAIMVSLWPPVVNDRQWSPARVLFLFAVCAFTVKVSLSLSDKVAVVASLAGSLLVVTTSVTFPAVAHMVLSMRKDRSLPTCELVKYSSILTFGALMATVGSVLAVCDLLP